MARTNIMVFGLPVNLYTIISTMLFFYKVFFGIIFIVAWVSLDKCLKACCTLNQYARDSCYLGLLVFIQLLSLASESVFSTSDFVAQPRPAVATP